MIVQMGKGPLVAQDFVGLAENFWYHTPLQDTLICKYFVTMNRDTMFVTPCDTHYTTEETVAYLTPSAILYSPPKWIHAQGMLSGSIPTLFWFDTILSLPPKMYLHLEVRGHSLLALKNLIVDNRANLSAYSATTLPPYLVHCLLPEFVAYPICVPPPPPIHTICCSFFFGSLICFFFPFYRSQRYARLEGYFTHLPCQPCD